MLRTRSHLTSCSLLGQVCRRQCPLRVCELRDAAGHTSLISLVYNVPSYPVGKIHSAYSSSKFSLLNCALCSSSCTLIRFSRCAQKNSWKRVACSQDGPVASEHSCAGRECLLRVTWHFSEFSGQVFRFSPLPGHPKQKPLTQDYVTRPVLAWTRPRVESTCT